MTRNLPTIFFDSPGCLPILSRYSSNIIIVNLLVLACFLLELASSSSSIHSVYCTTCSLLWYCAVLLQERVVISTPVLNYNVQETRDKTDTSYHKPRRTCSHWTRGADQKNKISELWIVEAGERWVYVLEYSYFSCYYSNTRTRSNFRLLVVDSR